MLLQNWSKTESKFELLNLLQYSQSRSRRRSRGRRPKPSKMGRLRNTSQIFSFLTVWRSPSPNIKYIYQDILVSPLRCYSTIEHRESCSLADLDPKNQNILAGTCCQSFILQGGGEGFLMGQCQKIFDPFLLP